MSTSQIDRLLRDGIAAIRAGDKTEGRALLEQIIDIDPLREEAWLWLSAAVEDREEQIVCLQNVLTINPESKPARQGLEKLGVTLDEVPSSPALPETLPLTRHSAPDAVDGDLYALVSGLPRSKAPESADLLPAESWRAPLLDPDYEYESEATIARDRFGDQPPQTLGDLADVWVDLLLLNPYGGLEDELRRGPIPHILVNAGSAAILQGIGMFILFVMFVALPGERFTPPLIRSTVAFLAQANPDIELAPTEGGSGMLLDALGIPRPEDVAAEAASSTSTGIEQTITDLLTSPVLLTAGYAVLLFPGLLIEYLWYSMVASVICGMYGGKGSAVETMHAFTLALVPAAVVNIPFFAVLAFLPLGVALVAAMLVGLYRLYMSVLSFSTAQRYDRLGGAGMMIMSIIIANGVWGVLGFLLNLVIG